MSGQTPSRTSTTDENQGNGGESFQRETCIGFQARDRGSDTEEMTRVERESCMSDVVRGTREKVSSVVLQANLVASEACRLAPPPLSFGWFSVLSASLWPWPNLNISVEIRIKKIFRGREMEKGGKKRMETATRAFSLKSKR